MAIANGTACIKMLKENESRRRALSPHTRLTPPTLSQLNAKKCFGQHFLKDQDLIFKITDAFIKQYPYGKVLEIGPGTGALTQTLLIHYQEDLSVIEIDRDMLDRLCIRLPALQKTQIIHQDILSYLSETNLKTFMNVGEKKESLGIIGNLPYNIATPILTLLLTQPFTLSFCEHIVVMIQKEVAQSICADLYHSKKRTRLSLLAEYFCSERTILFDVPPSAFDPPPKVHSSVIYLKPKLPCPDRLQWQTLSDLLKIAFQHRRKTIFNALKELDFTLDMFKAQNIDPMQRAQTLSLKAWMGLLAKKQTQSSLKI